MSSTLNSVIERLRAFGGDKLEELAAREADHRSWLAAAVAEVRAQVAALAAPASKRQRLDDAGAAKPTAVEQQEQEQVREGREVHPRLSTAATARLSPPAPRLEAFAASPPQPGLTTPPPTAPPCSCAACGSAAWTQRARQGRHGGGRSGGGGARRVGGAPGGGQGGGGAAREAGAPQPARPAARGKGGGGGGARGAARCAGRARCKCKCVPDGDETCPVCVALFSLHPLAAPPPWRRARAGGAR